MKELIIGISGLVLGAVAVLLYRYFTSKRDVYVKYDGVRIDEIEKRAEEVLKEFQKRNPAIRTREDAIKELNRYRDIN